MPNNGFLLQQSACAVVPLWFCSSCNAGRRLAVRQGVSVPLIACFCCRGRAGRTRRARGTAPARGADKTRPDDQVHTQGDPAHLPRVQAGAPPPTPPLPLAHPHLSVPCSTLRKSFTFRYLVPLCAAAAVSSVKGGVITGPAGRGNMHHLL
jgi:hypothetical protein